MASFPIQRLRCKLGPVTQGALGRVAGLEKSWVSRLVGRFVEDGAVKRVPLASDHRSLQVLLTPALIEALTLLTDALRKKSAREEA